MQSPKAKLLQLCKQLKSPAPTYLVCDEKVDDQWICSCSISALETATGRIGDAVFLGKGPSKKLANVAVAQTAWSAVQNSGVPNVFKPPEDLEHVVLSALKSQVQLSKYLRIAIVCSQHCFLRSNVVEASLARSPETQRLFSRVCTKTWIWKATCGWLKNTSRVVSPPQSCAMHGAS